eukprot:15448189-Alexandrium_andersonii.AAC.1
MWQLAHNTNSGSFSPARSCLKQFRAVPVSIRQFQATSGGCEQFGAKPEPTRNQLEAPEAARNCSKLLALASSSFGQG